jgi:DNA-directed RNA polymerase alpha subunit
MADTPTVGEVAVLTDHELLNIRGLGQKTLQEVRQRIREVTQEGEEHGESCLQDTGEIESRIRGG